MSNASDKRCRRTHNTFCAQVLSFWKILPFFLDIVEEYCRAGEITDNNMENARCKVDT
jgi:hypothetical protein